MSGCKCMVLAGCLSVAAECMAMQPGPADLALSAPEQLATRGECPYEGCYEDYGKRWLATQDVTAYSAPPARVEAPSSSLQRITIIYKGTWITAETGIIISTKGEGRFEQEESKWGNDPANGSPPIANNPVLKGGTLIPLYGSGSEGCYRTVVEGRTLIACNVAVLTEPRYEWWIQVRTEDGLKAWVTKGTFITGEGMNDELSRIIMAPELAFSTKITRIEELVREGANINGSGGRYGMDPLDAVIASSDVRLARALISRGLNIRNAKTCPAYYAARYALMPGGDKMLDFLLESGMQLQPDCLGQPPLHVFLLRGIAADSYPVDQAIRVAKTLVRHGASVSQRDLQGHSIFEAIDKWRSHRLSDLRAALVQLQGTP